MGRAPCCDKANVKRGPWSPEEDAKLKDYINKHSTGGNWISLPQRAGLRRCGKSCRLRWLNYLRPNIKHGEFSDEEDRIICSLYANIGSRWSIIAAALQGRTDNDIKNYWNTKLKKKLMGLVSSSHKLIRPHINNHQTTSTHSSSISFLQSHCYNNPTSSASTFSGYETINHPTTPSNNFLKTPSCTSSISTCTLLQAQESSVGTTHNQMISHGREIEYNYGDQNLGFQNNLYNGVDENHSNSKFLITSGDHYGTNYADQGKVKPSGIINGCYDEQISTLDCSLEEIKQLISTNNISNNNLNSFFL